jgi:TRAP-type C4-dicarboxylate transport system substrate-binding protein
MTPTKKTGILTIIVLILALTPLSALTVKLGSPFPEGSAWDSTLKRMAAEWAEISGGQVRMRIYPGGVAGDEPDMIRKMRFGQLDAAVLTTMGLKSIVPNSFVMTLPGILQSEEELDFAIEEFAPRFDEDFVREGFRVMAWSKTGWAYFYAKTPARTPNLLRNEKLSVSNTDEELAANFKALRFNVVPVSMNQLMVSLQSGMVSAFYAPPLAAAAFQWFALAPYMIDFPFSPVLGGLVISERTWNRIPSQFHRELKAAIQIVARDFYVESERLNTEAMRVMNNNGLQLEKLTASEEQAWFDVMISGHALVVGDGKWVDKEIYDEFVSILEEMR